MALPASPVHGQLTILSGTEYQFDSDISAWVVSRSIDQRNLDSDILDVRALFNSGAQSSGFPVGSVVPFAKNSLPSGFLVADGSVFNTTLYPELFVYLDSEVLPDYTNRTFGFKAYDYGVVTNHDQIVFAIAGYNGAGLVTDSDVINAIVEQQTADLQSQINTLQEDLAQAIADRVFTDNQLTSRLNGHDSDISLRGRFYVQSTPPSGGPNSGWVNTTNLRLNVWDETSDTWVEVTLT